MANMKPGRAALTAAAVSPANIDAILPFSSSTFGPISNGKLPINNVLCSDPDGSK